MTKDFSEPRRASTTVFVLGIWIGATAIVLAVVGASFPGIRMALENHAELEKRVALPADDEASLKTSNLWVFVGEQNRLYFRVFNFAQLGLAAIAVLLTLVERRLVVSALVLLATLIVVGLTFWLAPQLVEKGRALDFVPRVPEPPAEYAEFMKLHKLYTGLEIGKLVLLFIAAHIGLKGR